MEIWKDIIGWEGYYKISNFGNVKSLDRIIQRYSNIEKRITDFKLKGKLLKPKTRKDGYKIIYLHKDKLRVEAYIHKLVMQAFVGERPKDYHICHGDGNRGNNLLSNLRYDTASANSIDSLNHGTCYFNRGDKNPYSKIKEKDVPYILENKNKKTQDELAEEFNVTRQAISSIQRKINFKYIKAA